MAELVATHIVEISVCVVFVLELLTALDDHASWGLQVYMHSNPRILLTLAVDLLRQRDRVALNS
jgi:hypothetical protein